MTDNTSNAETSNVAGSPAPTTKALHTIPSPVGDFVGRATEIEYLVQSLDPANREPAEDGEAADDVEGKVDFPGGVGGVVGISGVAGMGSTQLAYVVAQRVSHLFPDAQLLIDMRGSKSDPESPLQALSQEQALKMVIQTFEPEASLHSRHEDLHKRYLSLLRDKRVLIVADDAIDFASHALELVPPAGSALIITSRTAFGVPRLKSIDLDTLDQSEAIRLLLEICPQIGASASRLAELCGGFPLALRLNAGLIAAGTDINSDSIEQHIRALEDQLEHLKQNRDTQEHDTSKIVEAALQLVYDALDENTRTFLCQLSVFPANFDREAALQVATYEMPVSGLPTDPTKGPETARKRAEEALDLLCSYSLVQWYTETERYSLHDLVRDFASARLADKDVVHLRHATYFAHVAGHIRETWKQRDGEGTKREREALVVSLRLFDLERTNIDWGWYWATDCAADEASLRPEIANLLIDYADATLEIGRLRYDRENERLPQLHDALQVAQASNDRAAQQRFLQALGELQMSLQDEVTAFDLFGQSLRIAREIGDREAEENALFNLGAACFRLGDMKSAIMCLDRSLQVAREIGDRKGEGLALGNLGTIYREQGELDKAITYYEQGLEIARETGNRTSEGTTLGNIGTVYDALGDKRKAITYVEQALAIARETGDRSDEELALGNLGLAYDSLGETENNISYTEQAISYYEQGLLITRDLGNRQREALALGNLGLSHEILGESANAVAYYEQSLRVAGEIGDRVQESRINWNMGLLLERQGDLERAVQFMRSAVEIDREINSQEVEAKSAHLEYLEKKLRERKR